MKMKMKISPVTVAWIAGLMALAVLSVSAVNHKKAAMLNGIAVDIQEFAGGNQFLTEHDVREEILAVTGTLEGRNIGDVDVTAVEEALYANPYVRHTDAYISSDRVLTVSILQRKPLFRVFDNKHGSFYVDEEGVLLPVSPHFTARVTVVTGDIGIAEGESVIDHPPLERLYRLVQRIDDDVFLRSLIEQIHYSSARRVVLVPKIGDMRIEFGELRSIDAKLENLKGFYTQVMKYRRWNEYQSINLAYNGQIVCKRKAS